jgi:hypothetical protein
LLLCAGAIHIPDVLYVDVTRSIALFALLVSGLNAYWTYYKDTHYRANVRISLAIIQKASRMVPVMEIINHGPGTIVIDYYIHDSFPLWKFWLWNRCRKKFIFPNPMNIKLGPGEVIRQEQGLEPFLAGKGATVMGICDTMRNFYFVPYFEVRRVNWEVRNTEPGKSIRNIKPPQKKGVEA